ncbi:hypothetical protein EMIT0P258_20215 [Pseudomonas sp. IT-P258]
MSVNILLDCYNAFASKPAPTGIVCGQYDLYHAKPRKMALILKQNGDHWPPFSASAEI